MSKQITTQSIKYRVMVGADGDDYVYASNLSLTEATRICTMFHGAPGVYAYVEPDR